MEIPLRCEHCAESDDFTSPLALQKHMDEVHPKRFRCSFSKTRFSFREEAVKHFRYVQKLLRMNAMTTIIQQRADVIAR